LQNDTKNCGNFLWILFKSSLKDITIDKLALENLLLGDVDGFRKILEINHKKEDNPSAIIHEDQKNKSEEMENGNILPQPSTVTALEDQALNIKNNTSLIDNRTEVIEKVGLPAENCFLNKEMDVKKQKSDLTIEAFEELFDKKENEDEIREKINKESEIVHVQKNEIKDLSNGDIQENEDIW
ncbi:MAG: hypothetical protein ACKO96_35565, partial [Flammeovirgaceae bacterium]